MLSDNSLLSCCCPISPVEEVVRVVAVMLESDVVENQAEPSLMRLHVLCCQNLPRGLSKVRCLKKERSY